MLLFSMPYALPGLSACRHDQWMWENPSAFIDYAGMISLNNIDPWFPAHGCSPKWQENLKQSRVLFLLSGTLAVFLRLSLSRHVERSLSFKMFSRQCKAMWFLWIYHVDLLFPDIAISCLESLLLAMRRKCGMRMDAYSQCQSTPDITTVMWEGVHLSLPHPSHSQLQH